MSIFAHKPVQILLIHRRFSKPQVSDQRSQIRMKTGEVRPVEKLKAVQRGRKIRNLAISLIFSCVVTAAAQSERINQESEAGSSLKIQDSQKGQNAPALLKLAMARRSYTNF